MANFVKLIGDVTETENGLGRSQALMRRRYWSWKPPFLHVVEDLVTVVVYREHHVGDDGSDNVFWKPTNWICN